MEAYRGIFIYVTQQEEASVFSLRMELQSFPAVADGGESGAPKEKIISNMLMFFSEHREGDEEQDCWKCGETGGQLEQ